MDCIKDRCGYGLSLHGFRNVWADCDRATLEAAIQPYLEWAQVHDVPLWVGEFGSMRHAPDDSGYRVIEDMIAIMNEHDLGWALWSYRDNDHKALVSTTARTRAPPPTSVMLC